jgi:hypothetical protein
MGSQCSGSGFRSPEFDVLRSSVRLAISHQVPHAQADAEEPAQAAKPRTAHPCLYQRERPEHDPQHTSSSWTPRIAKHGACEEREPQYSWPHAGQYSAANARGHGIVGRTLITAARARPRAQLCRSARPAAADGASCRDRSTPGTPPGRRFRDAPSARAGAAALWPS